MDSEQFVHFCKDVVGFTKNKDKIRQKLDSAKFRRVDSGSYKEVYKHEHNRKFVLKLYKERNTWQNDSKPNSLPPELDKFVLKPVYWCRRYMVQPTCTVARDLRFKTSNEIAKLFEFDGNLFRFDLHWANIGWYEGRYVIFDYLI